VERRALAGGQGGDEENKGDGGMRYNKKNIPSCFFLSTIAYIWDPLLEL
jgi:hypothetical protein